jgi:hypothetical protein
MLDGVEPDLVPVRVVQLGQDPADAGPVHAGVRPAETYLLITRLTGWDLDTYQGWLATTFARLARVADGNS